MIAIGTFDAADTCPLARTVTWETEEAVPYVPAVTPVEAICEGDTESVCHEGAEVVPVAVKTWPFVPEGSASQADEPR